MIMRICLPFLLLLAPGYLLAVPVASAQETISTDRPGLGYNPTTISPGIFQVELGTPSASASEAGAANVQTFSFPAALRLGVTDALELRLNTSVYDIAQTEIADETESEGQAGFDVLEAGVKLNFAAQAGFDAAVIPSIFIPTEGGPVTVSGIAVAGWSLPNAFGLTTAAGAAVTSGDVSGTFVALLGRGLTDRLGSYVAAAAYPADGATPVFAGAGLTLLLTPDLQLDAGFDRGFSEGAGDWLFGLGIAFRLR